MELFLYRKDSAFPLHGLFLTQAYNEKAVFCQFEDFNLTKKCSRTQDLFFSKIHMCCPSYPA